MTPAPRRQVTEADHDRVRLELARRSLRRYIRASWHVVEPATPYIEAWHIDAIADHLEAVLRHVRGEPGGIPNLLINIPPRHGKSLSVGVFWPTWAWLAQPDLRWLTASYDAELAVRDAVKSRRVIESPWYQRAIAGPNGRPAWRMAGDQNVKSRYENNRTGHRVAVGVGGAATGEGGHVVMVDDPHSAKGARSDAVREAALVWWDETMSTRLNDPKTGAKVIVMQRLHESDLSGHVLAQGGYEHLCIRTEFEVADAKRKTSIGWTDPRTTEGELLCPDRMGPAEVAKAKVALGSYGWVGQHQQRPAPLGGHIFQRSWFRFYTAIPDEPSTDLLSWDMTFKEAAGTDYVAGQAWRFIGARAYLRRRERKRADIVETLAMLRAMVRQEPRAGAKLVEDKANGPAVISLLRKEVPGLVPVEPDGGKVARAYAVQPFVEAGNVYVPDPSIAPWIDEWLDEICGFPTAAHDDEVDAFTQALAYRWLAGTVDEISLGGEDLMRRNPWAIR